MERFALDDPLERSTHRRLVVTTSALAAVASLVVSAADGSPPDLPGVALGSPGLLHLERSLLAGAATAASLIFMLPGWAGYFPAKLSTSGAEYLARSATHDAIQNADEVTAVIAGMKQEYVALIESVRQDVQALERRYRARGSSTGPDER